MEPLKPRGLDPEIIKAIDKAVRASGIAAQSRPQETKQLPAAAGGISWTGVGALVAAFMAMIVVVVWQGNIIRTDINARLQAADTAREAQYDAVQAQFDAMHSRFDALQAQFDALRSETKAEISILRSEISTLRSETKAEFDELRSAISSFEERLLRIENLIEDRWPSSAP